MASPFSVQQEAHIRRLIQETTEKVGTVIKANTDEAQRVIAQQEAMHEQFAAAIVDQQTRITNLVGQVLADLNVIGLGRC